MALVDRFKRITLGPNELEKLGQDINVETAARRNVHVETAARLWKSLTKEDHITILRHGALQSNIRRFRGAGDLGDDFLLVDEDLLVQAEATAIENLSNVVQSQDPWGENGSKDSMLANLIDANKTEVALKLVTLFSASSCTKPLVEKLFNPPRSCSNESVKRRENVTGSILTLAARTGHLRVFKEYLSGVQLHQRRESNGDTLLHIAAEHGHMDDVSELLEAGAKCELNAKSWTPLHSAAAAKKPNAAIAAQLVQYICQNHGASYINQQSACGNTALHIAAYNVNMTADFLYQLRDSDPFSVNDKGLTPLDAAASAADCPHIIVAMLDVFLPIMSRAELEDNSRTMRISNMRNFDAISGACVFPTVVKETGPVKAVRFKLLLRKSLLETCIRNGLVDAVVLLVEHGTDMSNALHMIVAESVVHPEKIDKLKAIYRSVVDQVMRPRHWWLKTSGIGFFEEDVLKDEQIRQIIRLIETPSELYQGMNAIELAVHTGAQEMLEEIVNTLNVYRFEKYLRTSYSGAKIRSDRVIFDVTNMTNEKYNRMQTGSPKTCYLEAIVSHEEIWRESDLLDKEPFKKLTMPHVTFVQRIYLFMGLIQMIFMIILSIYHLPSTCSLNDQFGLNISWCQTQEYGSCSLPDDYLVQRSLVNCIGAVSSTNVRRVYPNGAWLIWPVILCFLVACSVTNDLLTWLLSQQFKQQCSRKNFFLGRSSCCCLRKRSRSQQPARSDALLPKAKARPETAFVKLLSIVLKHMPHLAFSVAVFVWFDYYKNVQQFTLFLEALSVVFLFGWMLAFFHMSGISKHMYIFSMILKEIIIKDILSNFMPIFLFTVVGFGFAMHVLTQTMLPADTVMSVNVTIYNTFLATVNLGTLVQATFDPNYYIVNGRLGFFRVMVAFYITFAAIILLQVLVSMFTTRYQSTVEKVEYMWRFDCIAVVITLQKLQLGLRRLTARIGHGESLIRFIDAIPYVLYKCECQPDADKNDRYFINVKTTRVQRNAPVAAPPSA